MNSKLQFYNPNKIAKKKILVIDDNADILTLVQYSLEDIGGWDVMTANSGYEALVKVMTEKPDAIILDGIMPGMDGLTFLQELRRSKEIQSLPVVLLTGSISVTQHIQSLDLDVVGTITKPFDPILLAEQIAQFLGWTTKA